MNRLYFLVPTAFLAALLIPDAKPARLQDPVPTAKTEGSTLPGDVVTLFSNDDLMCAYSMRRKDFGMVIQDGEVRNFATDIMFDRYGSDVLAIAVEGGSKGAIVDLGDVKITGTQHSAFWSLGRSDDQITCSQALLVERQLPDLSKVELRGTATAPAVLGHTYVMKWFHSDSKSPSYAALKVIDLSPQRSVTIRWRLLD